MEYTIKMIDGVREWNGPNGVVHYITCGLEGHDKLVSIGKKSPDALKVGDVVTGTIIPKDGITDGFKSEYNPQATQRASGAFTSKSSPSDQKFLKDLTDMPIRVWNGALNYAGQAGLNLMGSDTDFETYKAYVESVVEWNMEFCNRLRGSQGGGEGAHHTPQEIKVEKPQPATSLKDKWKQTTGQSADEVPLSLYDEEGAL